MGGGGMGRPGSFRRGSSDSNTEGSDLSKEDADDKSVSGSEDGNSDADDSSEASSDGSDSKFPSFGSDDSTGSGFPGGGSDDSSDGSSGSGFPGGGDSGGGFPGGMSGPPEGFGGSFSTISATDYIYTGVSAAAILAAIAFALLFRRTRLTGRVKQKAV